MATKKDDGCMLKVVDTLHECCPFGILHRNTVLVLETAYVMLCEHDLLEHDMNAEELQSHGKSVADSVEAVLHFEDRFPDLLVHMRAMVKAYAAGDMLLATRHARKAYRKCAYLQLVHDHSSV